MDAILSYFNLTSSEVMHIIFCTIMVILFLAGKIGDYRHKREMQRLKDKRVMLVAEFKMLIENTRQSSPDKPH